MTINLFLFTLIFWSNLSVDKPKSAKSWHNNPVVAHRGAWKMKKLPENSIASLQEAIRLNCTGSEFDVQWTADSVLVVNHNADFQGMIISKTSFKDLREKRLSNGEFLPTAKEYLQAGMRQKKTRLVFEIKPQGKGVEHDVAMAEACYQLVKELKAEPWVDYISFSYAICKYLSNKPDKPMVQYLNGDKSPQQLLVDKVPGLDYHFNVFKKESTWMDEAKRAKLVRNVWTVNQEAEMRNLLAQGIDLITTDEPELLFSVIKTKP